MKHDSLKIWLWLAFLLGAMQVTCAADPWPEPDDMQDTKGPGDKDTSEDGSGGEVPAGEDGDDGDDKNLDDGETSKDGEEEPPPSADTDTGSMVGDTALDTGELEGTDTEGVEDKDSYFAGTDTGSTDHQETDFEGDGQIGADAGDTREDSDIDSNPDWGADAGTDQEPEDASSVLSQVYCSAPGPSGMVTVVGLPGTVLRQGQVEALHGGESYAMPVGSNGGFVGRFPAGPHEPVEIVVKFAESEQDRITIMTGSLDSVFIGDGITGPAGTVTKLPDEDQVVIHGQGERLEEDHLIIGGNLNEATGSGAWLSCTETDCAFDLWLPGKTGDEVDIFLVPGGKHWGSSDSQTVRIP